MKVLIFITIMAAYVHYVHQLSLQVNDSLNNLRTVYSQPIDWANRQLPAFDKL